MTSTAFLDSSLLGQTVIPIDTTGGKYPGIALVNLGGYSRTYAFTLAVYDSAGNLRKIIQKAIASKNMTWFSLLGENPELANIKGQIRVTGAEYDMSAFSLQFTPNGAFTSVPIVGTFGMEKP